MRATINARQTVLDHLPRNSVGAEVGVFKGDFSALILKQVSPKKLYLIDPWLSVDSGIYRVAMYGSQRRSQADMDDIAAEVATRFSREVGGDQIAIVRQASATALSRMSDGALDWIYIDGDHTYQAVVQDLTLAFQKVKAGGLIAGDDYTLGNWFTDGVVRGLHQFLAEQGSAVKIVFVIDGQFMLRKIA